MQASQMVSLVCTAMSSDRYQVPGSWPSATQGMVWNHASASRWHNARALWNMSWHWKDSAMGSTASATSRSTMFRSRSSICNCRLQCQRYHGPSLCSWREASFADVICRLLLHLCLVWLLFCTLCNVQRLLQCNVHRPQNQQRIFIAGCTAACSKLASSCPSSQLKALTRGIGKAVSTMQSLNRQW